MSNTEREIAQKTQEKFEFYLISLVFTLLALSIQTSKFGVSAIADSFELIGWLSLLVSGVSGLWRIEYLSVERMKLNYKDELQNQIYNCNEIKLKGATEIYVLEDEKDQPIEERIKNLNEGIKALNPVIKKLERHNNIKYKTHRVSFLLGVISIIVARGYIPAGNVFAQIKICL